MALECGANPPTETNRQLKGLECKGGWRRRGSRKVIVIK